MGSITKSLVFLSSILLHSAILALALTEKKFASAIIDSRSSPPGNPTANLTAKRETLERTLEVKTVQVGELFPKRGLIRNDHDDVKIVHPPNLVEQRFDGADSDDIKEFAVFVDSPGDSDESSSDGIRHDGSFRNDDEGDVDDDLVNETSMKQVLSNKFRNGSVIHDIRIAVKHPQNLKGHKRTKGRGHKQISGKRTTAKSTSHSTREILGGNGETNTGLPTTVHANCNSSSCPDQTSGELTTDESTFTILNGELHPTNLSETIITYKDNETTTLLDGLSLNSTETDTELVSSTTVERDLTASGMCSNTIYLNVTNSENCVSQCLISCIMSKKNVSIDEISASPEEQPNIHKNLSTEVPICTYYPDIEDNNAEPNVTEHNNTETVNSTLSSTFRTKEEGTTIEEKTAAPLHLNVPIGSEIKHNLLETSEVKKSDVPFLLKDICLTKTCVLKAAEFLKRMNTSVDPCVNFYEFTCGGFLKHEIPNDDLLWSVFSEVGSDIIFRVISVLKEPAKTSEPNHVIELKHFFAKCVKTPIRSLLMEVLQELGGWPAPHDPSWKIPSLNWQEIAFNWTYGVFAEHNFVLLNISYFNRTGKWILNLDLPIFVKVALSSNSLDVLKGIERETATLAILLGVDNDTIIDSIEVLHLFMEYAINYANISQMKKQEGFYTLRQLKKKFPHLTLLKNLPSLLETSASIDDNELIRVSDVVYLQKINTLIRDTPVKTQAALLVISAMRVLYNLVTTTKDATMARYCVKLAWQLYPNIIGNIYSSNFVDDSAVSGVVKILSQVKNRLEKTLKESSLKDETKLKAAEGLKSLSFIVTNRLDSGFDRTGLTELVDVLNSSFAPMLKAGMWNFKRGAYAFLHQDYNFTLPKLIEKYSGNKYHVNAFFVSSYVFIPLTVMHENIYDDALPSYVNFAGVGIILGHEIVHGVVQGGFLQNSTRYLAEEQCMIDQFSDFTERYLGLPIDGRATKDENLADLGGFREAYLAYTEWTEDRSENELKLPGLHGFNDRQMFWLTAASNWCQVASREAMVLALHQDTHAPSENRINGQLANLPEFSRDFHCPLNSPMNPRDKCSLW